MKSITLKIYERILAEAKKNGNAEKLKPTKKKLNKPKEEAPDDAILGNYAFANVRPGIPPEVNTAVEDKLEQELTTHFVNNQHVSAKSGQALKTSLENDWYEKILSEPEQATVYRGIRVSEEWMVKNIGENWRKQFAETSFSTINGIETRGRLKPNNMVLRPKTGSVTSWTTNFNIASAYSYGVGDNRLVAGNHSMVFCAAIKDNPNQFIDSAAGLYGIKGIKEFAKEQEVLGIGSITVSHVIWYV